MLLLFKNQVLQLIMKKKYMPQLIELIKSKGAKPVLYCTHEYYNNAYNTIQKDINQLYYYFGDKYNVPVIPVGDICKKIRNDENLIIHNIPDVIHANKFGVDIYINTFYYFLTNEFINENFQWSIVETVKPAINAMPKAGQPFNKEQRKIFGEQSKEKQIISG